MASYTRYRLFGPAIRCPSVGVNVDRAVKGPTVATLDLDDEELAWDADTFGAGYAPTLFVQAAGPGCRPTTVVQVDGERGSLTRTGPVTVYVEEGWSTTEQPGDIHVDLYIGGQPHTRPYATLTEYVEAAGPLSLLVAPAGAYEVWGDQGRSYRRILPDGSMGGFQASRSWIPVSNLELGAATEISVLQWRIQ